MVSNIFGTTASPSSRPARAEVLLASHGAMPHIMLVDEPSAHLDLRYKLEVMEHLRDMLSGTVTIVIASHDLNLLAKYCDKVMILSRGKIVAMGTPEEVITPEIVADVYGVDVAVIKDGDNIFAIPRRTRRDKDDR